MLETYRGIPHLLDTWLVLTGMTLPVALSSFRRPGDLVPRLAAFCLPAAFALVIAATLSPTTHRLGQIGECGTHLTTTGGLTSLQGLLNVVLFVPAAGMLTLASGRPGDGIAAGIGMSAAVEAVQALLPQLGRSCQLHDLIANSLGAFCGVGLAAGLQTLTRRLVARPGFLVVSPAVVEHAAMLVVRRPRHPGRHRRGTLAQAGRPARYHSTNTQLSG
ncbi:VanZ family protein [Kribbella sindirgiensis]|uniref:VanZ family protein n=1 Tax=Kribbella sindirgiensis TaxID=1124744 RepID=A0A4R0JA91_9ACTN|nr:VanZ family protein [Kribbella sindirgiensis]TCC43521.1 VanZ family protein [Kribbella sindirgiensis]